MRRKKLICAMMALVLLFSATPSALAAGNIFTTTITGTPFVPTINVDVPGGGGTLLNPLSLPVTINGEETDEQVISTPGYIANMSNVPLNVTVEVKGTILTGSNMKLTTAPTRTIGSSKEAFLYFEMVQSDSAETNDVRWEAYDFAKHIIIGTTKVKKSNVMTLSAMTEDGKVAEGGYAHYRVAGDAVKSPKSAWSSSDGVTVQVAFTFAPISYV